MRQVQTVIFDNEAVQALADVTRRKHRRLLAIVDAVAARNLRRAGSVGLIVPTAVRVEAGWDRHAPGAATVNRLRIQDAPLGTEAADGAARARVALASTVADAHIASTLETTSGPHAVLTGDPEDIRRIAQHLGVQPNIVIV